MTTPSPPGAEGDRRDLASEATELIESVVLTVKEKATIPLTTAARAVVYGLVIAVLGVVALILLVVAVVRISDVWLIGWAGRVHGAHRLWIVYGLLGLLFSLGGLALWSRRTTKESA